MEVAELNFSNLIKTELADHGKMMMITTTLVFWKEEVGNAGGGEPKEHSGCVTFLRSHNW